MFMSWKKQAVMAVLGVSLLTLSSFGGNPQFKTTPDPFPALSELPQGQLMPRKNELEVSPEGHFLVAGQARYLPGVLFYEGTLRSLVRPAFGYDDSLKWIYENFLDYEGAQRIGFDLVGVFTPSTWMKKYRPNHYDMFDHPEQYRRTVLSELPLYVDYTSATWHHGGLNAKKDKTLPAEAFTHGHFMSYDMVHPVGRGLYLEYLQYGARVLRDLGAKPLVYELFNEPGPNANSPAGRQEFARRMQQKYGSVEKLNQACGVKLASFDELVQPLDKTPYPVLALEWLLFTQDVFHELCADGIQAIRHIDPRPEAGFCVQPTFMRYRGIDIYRLNTLMNFVSSSTGGGNALQAHCLRAMADGKPISDGEMYSGKSRTSTRNAFLKQFARGFNASIIFKWDKRSYDWLTHRKDEQGKSVFDVDASIKKALHSAEKFPYNVLNPWAVQTEALLGIRDAKDDTADVNFLFAPRKRGVPRQVALLYSTPTDNVAEVLGHTNRKLLDSYSLALEYAHIPQDIVFEQQLSQGRHLRYPVLIVPGVDAVYGHTPEALRQYVAAGGTLLLAQETLERTDMSTMRSNNTFPGLRTGKLLLDAGTASFSWKGRNYAAALYKDTPVSPEWTTLARIGERPVLSHQRIGKGHVYFLNATMSAETLSQFLTDFLDTLEIRPVCDLVDLEHGRAAPTIEVNKAVRDGFTGYLLMNCGLGSQLVRFRPQEQELSFCRIEHADKARPRQLLEQQDGGYALLLKPGHVVVLVGSTTENLRQRYGDMPRVSDAEVVSAGRAILTDERERASSGASVFQVDANAIRTIDLRAHVNRAFVDTVAGDGKGGWTDQGDNSLHGTQWGIQDCAGVPMEFIRVDQNYYKTCLVLGSKQHPSAPLSAHDIPVQLKAKNLYFLHATAWTGNGTRAFSYIVHYNDGTSLELPIRDKIEVNDWYWASTKLKAMTAYPGWLNAQKRGLYIWKWENPQPHKQIRSLDVVSANTNSIPIIVAISAELADEFDPEPLALPFKTQSAGCYQLEQPFVLSDDFASATLALKLKLADDSHVQVHGLRTVTCLATSFVPDADGTRTFYLPLERLLSQPRQALTAFRVGQVSGAVPEVLSANVLRWYRRPDLTPRSGVVQPRGWAKDVMPTANVVTGAFEFPIASSGGNFCGGLLSLAPAVAVQGKETVFRFHYNTVPDPWGQHQRLPGLQICFVGKDADGKKVSTPYLKVVYNKRPDDHPDTWQDAIVKLDKSPAWRRMRQLTQINVQYTYVHELRSGIAVKNLRFE